MEEPVTTTRKRYSPGQGATTISGGGGVVYGLGLVGALIYFLQHAVGLWPIVLAILKAIVWPTFIVFKLLENLFG